MANGWGMCRRVQNPTLLFCLAPALREVRETKNIRCFEKREREREKEKPNTGSGHSTSVGSRAGVSGQPDTYIVSVHSDEELVIRMEMGDIGVDRDATAKPWMHEHERPAMHSIDTRCF
ncbi:hypothetical protein LX32DRAFT_656143 [Colletotrichum zoysiae]|uniref:Uncharacterized protein n=1 Tax=Colletotrichum zoysiae TaxID=1216348 RepID=A0AAD9HA45_9PEZI|nr:hypothetical protein LX32DRAFT_656143 [Colletotrichum zoysiae]